MKNKVVAVVVTYNRKELLCECLDALLAQTLPVEKIVLVNNASTDGTEKLLQEKGYLDRPQVDYVLQPKNIGGAGGFYEGLKRARDVWGFDWAWLMDDDTIPTPTALAEFMKGASRLRELDPQMKIGFLSGTIYDGEGRANNAPALSVSRDHPWYQFLRDGFVRIRIASFVSYLVSSEVVKCCGLPCRNFFIWGDDEEYSMRICRFYGEGWLVGLARIVHKQGESPDILTTSNLNRIRMRRHGCRNGIVIAKYYGNVFTVTKFVMKRLMLAGQCLLTHHGILKSWTILVGLFDGFIQFKKFKGIIDSEISAEDCK